MEPFPGFAGFAQGGRGINDGLVWRALCSSELLASISQAKAELCAVINANK